MSAILAFVFPFLLSIGSFPEALKTPPDNGLSTSSAIVTDKDKEDSVRIAEIISFAQTLKGTKYKYASADPKNGFDCSGFVMYVFNHFEVSVPRSSIDYTKVGQEVDLKDAQPGDVILFTGTNSEIRRVGHVGIITQSGDNLSFIHASSGKTYSVTETSLTPHYQKRFIKVVRVLK